MRKLIPKPIRRQLSKMLFPKSPVWWANYGTISRYLADHIRPQSPPVVILSLPRSGSSWVGEMLSLSPTAMYLREPITQTYLQKVKKGSSSFFEFDIHHLPDCYEHAAHLVFSGLPLFDHWITKTPNQWQLTKRKKRRIVVKEVNPFMLDWLMRNFQPKIIFLIRHPVAVASSFNRMGWNGKQFEFRLLSQTLESKIPDHKQYEHSFWAEHGALQGFIINQVFQHAKGYKNCRIIKYEDLCADPIKLYKELYDFAGLKWNAAVETKIRKQSRPKEINNNAYSTRRNSAYEMDKWKKEVPLEKICELKQAYLSFNPPFYQNDWPI